MQIQLLSSKMHYLYLLLYVHMPMKILQNKKFFTYYYKYILMLWILTITIKYTLPKMINFVKKIIGLLLPVNWIMIIKTLFIVTFLVFSARSYNFLGEIIKWHKANTTGRIRIPDFLPWESNTEHNLLVYGFICAFLV